MRSRKEVLDYKKDIEELYSQLESLNYTAKLIKSKTYTACEDCPKYGDKEIYNYYGECLTCENATNEQTKANRKAILSDLFYKRWKIMKAIRLRKLYNKERLYLC